MTNNDSNNDNSYDHNYDLMIYTNKETVATVNDSLVEKSHVSCTSQSSSSNADESIGDSLTMMIQYTPLQPPAVVGTLHLTTEQEPMNQYVQEM
jgi:hypothetical protein